MQARPSSAAMPALADIGLRADRDIELGLVRADQQVARPVAVGLVGREPLARRGDLGLAGLVGEGEDPVGIADVERRADQRHAEGLVEASEEGLADLGDAVAVRVAQQRDAVGARPDAPARAIVAVIAWSKSVRGLPGWVSDFGGQHVAIGQHIDEARMLEAGGEGIDLEPGRRDRASCRRASHGRVGIFSEGRLPCGFASGITGLSPLRLHRRAAPDPRHGPADDRDDFRENLARLHMTAPVPREISRSATWSEAAVCRSHSAADRTNAEPNQGGAALLPGRPSG